jgi:hypothetical protein
VRQGDLSVVAAWLECLDCRVLFLQRLARIPHGRQENVAQFLSHALLNGPDSVRVARLDLDLGRVWYADSVYAARKGDSLHTTRVAFMQRYRRGFQVIWRSRAATALGVLQTPGSLKALDRALQLPIDSIAPGDSTIARAVRNARAGKPLPTMIGVP